jgi:periplasmic copper chaperone A
VLTVIASASAAPALAHVTVNPPTAEKGGFPELVFRAPNEQDHADTTGVQVYLPTEHPLAFVSVHPTPGWQVKVDKTKLAKPIKSDDGDVTEAVASITWTGDLRPGEYQNFAVSVGPLPDDADRLVFKVLQTYSNGDVVRWIELPSGGKEPAHPAPVLTLTNPGGAAGTGSPSAARAAIAGQPLVATSSSSASTADGLARGLGVAGLVLGLLALAVALVRGRRGTQGTPTP